MSLLVIFCPTPPCPQVITPSMKSIRSIKPRQINFIGMFTKSWWAEWLLIYVPHELFFSLQPLSQSGRSTTHKTKYRLQWGRTSQPHRMWHLTLRFWFTYRIQMAFPVVGTLFGLFIRLLISLREVERIYECGLISESPRCTFNNQLYPLPKALKALCINPQRIILINIK